MLRISKHGSTLHVVVDRPAALNALTIAMRAELSGVFPRAARDPDIYCVVVTSATPRAFCAGGDVRELIALSDVDPAAACDAVIAECRQVWLHECFSKPTVPLIDGAVMGSGVGATLNGTHRIAGPAYRFAMPETAIGFFPNVGTAYHFARMPHGIGLYLGLTGRGIGRADALALGLVTHCIAPRHFAAIAEALADTQPVDPLLDALHEEPGPGELAPLAPVIERCFGAPHLSEIVRRLEAEAVGGAHSGWAAGVLADMAKRSPFAMAVALRHIRQAAGLDLRLTLIRDARLACYFLAHPDFREGVRAQLIAKDRRPRWTPAAIGEVSEAMVGRAFEPRGAGELVLPPRQEMQSLRV